MNIYQIIFLVTLGMFALYVCVLAAVTFVVRIIYLIGMKREGWSDGDEVH